MEKKIACIVGNGLNFLIADIIENDFTKKDRNRTNKNKTKETAAHVRALAQLWEQFNCFDSIRNDYPQLKLNDEDMIGFLYRVSSFFEKNILSSHLPTETKIHLNKEIESFLISKIKEVNRYFQSYERTCCYTDIKSMFYDFGYFFRKNLNDNNVMSLNIYTTNYDGIIDTLLSSGDKYFPDGIGKQSLTLPYLELDNKKLRKQAVSLAHLHGSYKFCRIGNTTYKLRKYQENDFPVMVFNNPHLKEERIMEDSILRQYFENLKEDLRTCDRLIILGNSLKTEPHIKQIIKEHFNRINTELVVCDLYPEQVKQQLDGFYSNEIYQFTTARLDSEFNLSDLFNQLFSDDLGRCGRNINNFRIAA